MLSYDLARQTELVAQSCRLLGKLDDMTHGALGHVSLRSEEGESLLIKGKGVDESALRYTEPHDILEVDFDAEVVSGPSGLRAPSETFIHTQIFRAFPEARCAIHCHPRHAILVSICGLPLRPIYGPARPGALLAVEGVPTYHRSVRITTPELGDAMVKAMGSSKVVLMQGHGISVWGTSIEDATVRALALNELVTMTYQANLIGQPMEIPEEDYEDLRPAERPRGSAGGEASLRAAWRYYCRLADEEPV